MIEVIVVNFCEVFAEILQCQFAKRCNANLTGVSSSTPPPPPLGGGGVSYLGFAVIFLFF